MPRLSATCFKFFFLVTHEYKSYKFFDVWNLVQEIFELFVSMFAELSNTTSPYFSRRVKILETFAKYNFCMLMLDIDCDTLVLEMFNTFFSISR